MASDGLEMFGGVEEEVRANVQGPPLVAVKFEADGEAL